MANIDLMFMSTLSVVLFCLCCFQLMREFSRPVPVFNHSSYSKAALRVEKSYRVVAWTTMTGTVMLGLVMSFYEVYTRL